MVTRYPELGHWVCGGLRSAKLSTSSVINCEACGSNHAERNSQPNKWVHVLNTIQNACWRSFFPNTINYCNLVASGCNIDSVSVSRVRIGIILSSQVWRICVNICSIGIHLIIRFDVNI